MDKIYSFKKEVLFNNNIYDVISIAIDKKIGMDGYAIKGKFNINGEYLINEKEKDSFDIEIPYLNYIEDEYDISNIKIDIDDFYYEVKDSNKLVINIDIIVHNLEEKERCIDETISEEGEYDMETDETINRDFDNDIVKEISGNEFSSESNNNYVTYKVCIVRENDTIESIVEKYNISLDEIKKYNVINDIKEENKIIIPYEQNK